jgi:hypothetical protein
LLLPRQLSSENEPSLNIVGTTTNGIPKQEQEQGPTTF